MATVNVEKLDGYQISTPRPGLSSRAVYVDPGVSWVGLKIFAGTQVPRVFYRNDVHVIHVWHLLPWKFRPIPCKPICKPGLYTNPRIKKSPVIDNLISFGFNLALQGGGG